MQKQSYFNALKYHKNHWWWKSRKFIFLTLLKKYLKKKNLKILDFGSGIGSNLEILERFGECDAFEVNKIAIKYLKKKYNVITKIKKKYDLIFFADTLEHIDNDKKIINFLSKHLKKDGLIFITVPAYNFLWTSKDVALEHFRRYNKKSLLKSIPKKFKIIKLSYFNTFLFIPLSIILLFYKLFNINFINNAENIPNKLINKILFKIFSYEKKILVKSNFLFGLSLLLIIKNK